MNEQRQRLREFVAQWPERKAFLLAMGLVECTTRGMTEIGQVTHTWMQMAGVGEPCVPMRRWERMWARVARHYEALGRKNR